MHVQSISACDCQESQERSSVGSHPSGKGWFLSEDLGLKDIRPVRETCYALFSCHISSVSPLPMYGCIDQLWPE